MEKETIKFIIYDNSLLDVLEKGKIKEDSKRLAQIKKNPVDIISKYTKKHYKLHTVAWSDHKQALEIYLDHDQKTIRATDLKPDQVIKANHTKLGDGFANQDITYISLNKQIVRTIVLHIPEEKAKEDKQIVNFTRTALLDLVTGDVINTAWTSKANYFSKYIPQSIPGFTADLKVLKQQIVTESDQDVIIDIKYQPNKQLVKFLFIDNKTSKQIGEPVIYYGKTGSVINVNLTIPNKYQLAKDQALPRIYICKVNNNLVKIKLDHQIKHNCFITDIDDLDKLHLTNKDFTKTIKRLILANIPDKNGVVLVKDLSQKLKIKRSCNIDLVDNSITWNKWQDAKFKSIASPIVHGYVPSIPFVKSYTVKNGVYHQTPIKITYQPNKQLVRFIFIDSVNNKTVGKPIIVTGVTNQKHVKLDLTVPDNYQLSAGQQLPTNYNFKIDNPDQKIYLDHKINSHFGPINEQKLLNGIKDVNGKQIVISDFTKLIQRTIIANIPDHKGRTLTKDYSQQIKLQRSGQLDLVTHILTWNDWQKGEFSAVDLPEVTGYHANLSKVDSYKNVDANYQDPTLTIVYTPDKRKMTYQFVDQLSNKQVDKDIVVTGVTDQKHVKVNLQIPDNYQLADGQILPSSYNFGTRDEHTQIILKHKVIKDYSLNDNLPADLIDTNGHAVTNDSFKKTITRSITVKLPDHTGKYLTKDLSQAIILTRTGNLDLVTKIISWNTWSTGEFTDITVPTINGYKPVSMIDKSDVVNNLIPKITDVASDYHDIPLTIKYLPLPAKQKVIFVDSDNKQIASDIIRGFTDEIVPMPSIPMGWMTTDNYQNTIQLKPQNQIKDLIFEIKHQIHQIPDFAPDHIIAGDHQVPGDLRPNRDITYQDVHKTVTRSIQLILPDQSIHNIVAAINFMRHAKVDAVSGDITYTDWCYENQDHNFSKITLKNYQGYTCNYQEIPAINNVDISYQDPSYKVVYTPDKQTITYKFIDTQTHKQVGQDIIISGVSNQKHVATNLKVPTNYLVLDNQTVPEYCNFTTYSQEFTIKLKHRVLNNWDPTDRGQKQVVIKDIIDNNGQPVTSTSFNKILKRTIYADIPSSDRKDLSQFKTIYRTGELDLVTRILTWNDWTIDNFDQVQAPRVKGYTPNPDTILPETASIDWLDKTTIIKYVADKQTVMFQFVDAQKDNLQIGSVQVISGRTNQMVSVHLDIPENYLLADNTQLPTSYTFKAENPIVQIALKHKLINNYIPKVIAGQLQIPQGLVDTNNNAVTARDFKRKIMRSIHAYLPDNTVKDLTQSVTIMRTGLFDPIDNCIKWNSWSVGMFQPLGVPSVAGYTANNVIIERQVATIDYKDPDIRITYEPNNQDVNYVFVDTNNNVLDTQTITGKTGALVHFGLIIPDGYEMPFGKQLPKQYVFKAKNPDIKVTVEPIIKQTSVNSDTATKSVTRTVIVKQPDENGKITIKDYSQTLNLKPGEEGKFKAIRIPDIQGYRPSINLIPGTIVTDDFQDPKITIVYNKLQLNNLDDSSQTQKSQSSVTNKKTDKPVKQDTNPLNAQVLDDLLSNISSINPAYKAKK